MEAEKVYVRRYQSPQIQRSDKEKNSKKTNWTYQNQAKLIRCNNKIGGCLCGNPLAKVSQNKVLIKRNGREILVSRECSILIKCERCGKYTKI